MGWPRVGHNLIRSKGSGGFPDSSVGKASVCNAGDPGSNPGLGRSGGEVTGYPLQYSGLENSIDSVVHGGLKESDMTEQLLLSLSKEGGKYCR